MEDFSRKNSIFLFLLRSWKMRPPLSHLCSLLELARGGLNIPHPSWHFTPSRRWLFALPAWPLLKAACWTPGCLQGLGGGGGEKNTTQETGRKVFKRKHGIGAGLSGKIRSPVGIQSASESGSENQGFCLFIQSCLLLANCLELGKR